MNLRRRRPPQGISSPVIAEDAYWQQQAQWDTARLDTAAFARLLGVTTAALHKLLARDERFPRPVVSGRPNLWASSQAYAYIARWRPKRVAQIPRLYHHGNGLMPATWIAAERHVLSTAQGGKATWIVHVWQPADDRGPVAVAYTDDAVSEREARKWAPELLNVLHSVSSVIVVSEEWRPLPDSLSPGRYQPEIAVAERQPAPDGDSGVTTDTYGWFDLANLLRVNLPWWPLGLRRLDEMQTWRPGAAPQSVRAHATFFDEDILGRVLAEAADPAEASQCTGTVDLINARVEAGLYDPPTKPDVPGDMERPGLFQAAYLRYRTPTPPEPPSLYEILSLMNLRVPSEAARQRAVELLSHRDEVRAVVGHTIVVSEHPGPLAQEWISRLRPCDDPQSLGASFACRTFTTAQAARPRRWWSDPLANFGWIAQTADGHYHATVGTQMPARGVLDELEVELPWTAAFYRASGTVWPMPLGGDGYYTCGYSGTGPTNLISAVAELHTAADAVLSASSSTTGAPAALKELIRTREAPLFVSEEEFAQVFAVSD